MNRKNLIILFLAVFITATFIQTSDADIGTAFTYQGRLIDDNDVADGFYDFQFNLFNDPCAGYPVVGPVNEPGLDIIDGYFTVELDFNDPNAFNGDGRWLEIGVRPGELEDSNAYTILEPRQEITPTPYALYAMQTSGLMLPYLGAPSCSESAFLVRNYGSGKAIQGIGENNDGVAGGSYAGGRSGVFGYNDDANGFGVFGNSFSGIGVKGYTFGNGTAGVFEIENPSNTSTALYATTIGEGAAAHFIVNNAGSNASAVYAVTIGDGNAVYALSTGLSGTGVYGYASNNGAGINYGGYFEAEGISGRGLYGNSTGSDGIGIYGEATGGGKAGHFEGDVHVTGELTKAYTEGTSNPAAPIAYAFIYSGGTKASGTPNVSSTWNSGSQRYEITISGENYYYSDYLTVVTLHGSVGIARTDSVGGKLLIYIYDLSSIRTQSNFQFVTYKP